MKETEGAREKELKKLRELSTPEGAVLQESEGDEVSIIIHTEDIHIMLKTC